MGKKVIILLIISQIMTSIIAQETSHVGKGTIRTLGTITPGKLLKSNLNTMYVHGNLEYYLQDELGVKGDGYYFVGTQGEDNSLLSNHSIFFGPAWHFGKGNFDPFASFQPGCNLTKMNVTDPVSGEDYETTTEFVPLLSFETGINYFISPLFNFSASMRYQMGNFFSTAPEAINMNELRFSFGLGVNFGFLRKKEGA